jgi:tetratricopeptide (TPR) repeat protein
VPLLNVLHAESSAVVALVAFFASGWAALSAFQRGAPLLRVWGRQVAALAVPLALLTVSALWAPNCAYLTGLMLYGLFPGVTVAFAVALAYALSGTGWPRPHLLVGAVGVAIAAGGPLYDLGLHPQFYTYNHVFGGVLGPIYDEQLALRPGLFAFRGLTLLWAGVLVGVGRSLRGGLSAGTRALAVAGVLLIGAAYLFSARLGFNTPAWYTQEQLGGHVRTAHFDLYYDPAATSRAEVEALADAHEYHHARLHDRLDLDPGEGPGRIESYLYPNETVKARLTGARRTSVAPVWLPDAQVHLLRSAAGASLGHELAHLMGRPFGIAGLGASWAVGLVEGWAVALEAPSGAPSPDALVAVAAATDTTGALADEAEAVAARLSPLGFWTARGAVSYAAMGSFVRFLLDRYGAERLRRVYAWADFQAAYGRSLDQLAREWAFHLRRRASVPRAAYDVVARRFSQPSLFETRCPHHVPPHRRQLQAGEQALAAGDTAAARVRLREALRLEPRSAAAHRRLARLRIADGRVGAALAQLDSLAPARRTVGTRLARADALAIAGRADSARSAYLAALERVPASLKALQARIRLRDAVAGRPDAVRVLAGGARDSVQARRLRRLAREAEDGRAVWAWAALRHRAAYAPGRALDAWKRVTGSPLAPSRPPAWHRAWALQQKGWEARAEYEAGGYARAEAAARRAAARYRAYGAAAPAAAMDALARRAAWAAGPEGRVEPAVSARRAARARGPAGRGDPPRLARPAGNATELHLTGAVLAVGAEAAPSARRAARSTRPARRPLCSSP